MSYQDSHDRHPLPTQTFRSESGYSSPAPGSGAQTPTGTGAGSSQSPGLVSSIWGGLIRRFSAETPSLTHSHSYPADSSHSNSHAYNNNNGVDGVYVPPRFHEAIQRTVSPMQPPPLEPVQLRGFAPDTPQSARILTQAIAEEIRIMVPTRLGIVDEWNLIYSLDQDGASLGTLYDKCAKYSGRRVGFVLVVKDAEGGVSHYLFFFFLLFPSLPSHSNPLLSKPQHRSVKERKARMLTLISHITDLRRLPLRLPPSRPQILRNRRMFPLARLGHGLPSASSLRRHHQLPRPNIHHLLGRNERRHNSHEPQQQQQQR
ncbi:hypothetical protein SMACR_03491 [Sordaria macrospora]|uniref:TLDc domain-containing protein n=1 Tax=Sordaria macrospora TaxID=5147 RepID=A0A8S8ZKI1_SORMA|nr:hypothetical protein SMACR_03491 [Sordaria macrospora]